MKYQIIVSNIGVDVKRQFEEISGFIKASALEIEKENTIIISDGKHDGDDISRLTDMAPTSSVFFVLIKKYNPESILKVLENILHEDSIFLFGSSYLSLELAPRIAYRMQGASLIECSRLTSEGGRLYGEKLVYSNHMQGKFEILKKPAAIVLAKGIGHEQLMSDKEHEVRVITAEEAEPSIFLDIAVQEEEKETGFDQAEFVLIIGKGAKDQNTVDQLAEIGERLGAVVGGSRPVVMNAWMPMNKLVGASGSFARARVCIVAGASGAPALYGGIKKSKLVIGINTDEKAPLTRKADVTIIGDALQVMKAIEDKVIEERRNG
ncbi:MAG: FAD-binding protein [Lachnospiraceae bacterium]